MQQRYGMGSFTSLRDSVNACLPRGWSYIMFLSKIMMNLKRFLLGSCMMPSYPKLETVIRRFRKDAWNHSFTAGGLRSPTGSLTSIV